VQLREALTMWVLLIALVTTLNYTAVGMDIDVTINLICEFVTENKLKATVAMICWKKPGTCIRNESV
jgi:hypothetical protein